jgi:hypothetical protein
MSAQLLTSPNSVHQMEDDRESAFHVLLWVAMLYSRHHVLVRMPPTGNPSSSSMQDTPHTGMRTYTRQFDEAYIDDSGTVKGGSLKQNLFMSTDLSKLKFDGRPQLDALLEELAVALAVRYERPPEPDDWELLAEQEAFLMDNPDSPHLDLIKLSRDYSTAYRYQERKHHLETKRHWLVDTIRKHLNTGTWPKDKAEPQKISQSLPSAKPRTIRQF